MKKCQKQRTAFSIFSLFFIILFQLNFIPYAFAVEKLPHRDTAITRAEFVARLIAELSLPLENPDKPSFLDVSKKYWAYPYIETAKKQGIIEKKKNKLFYPRKKITRAQAAVMVAKALKLTAETDLKFSDLENATWAVPSIKKVVAAGIFKGYADNTFRPGKFLLRSEGLTVMTRVSKLLASSRETKVSTGDNGAKSPTTTPAKEAMASVLIQWGSGGSGGGASNANSNSGSNSSASTGGTAGNTGSSENSGSSETSLPTISIDPVNPFDLSKVKNQAYAAIEKKLPGYTYLNPQLVPSTNPNQVFFFAFKEDDSTIPFAWYLFNFSDIQAEPKRIITSSDIKALFWVAISPNGNEILVTTRYGEVYVMSSTNTNSEKKSLGAYLNQTKKYPRFTHPIYTPDGNYMIFYELFENSLFVVDAKTQEIEKGKRIEGFWITEGGGGGDSFTSGTNFSKYEFSNDGGKLIFAVKHVLNLVTWEKES